jgi:hypothetical protein
VTAFLRDYAYSAQTKVGVLGPHSTRRPCGFNTCRSRALFWPSPTNEQRMDKDTLSPLGRLSHPELYV